MEGGASSARSHPPPVQQAPGKQGYLTYRAGWRLFESQLWFELDEGSDYLTGSAKQGARPTVGIPLAKAEFSYPDGETKARKSSDGGKQKGRFKLKIKTSTGKEHTLVMTSEEHREEWLRALRLARDLALSGTQLLKQWQESGCQQCVGDPNEITDDVAAAEELLEPAPDEQIPPVALSAKLEDINGKVTSLKNILIGNRPMIVVFVRHFGCVLCRGASIVVIGNGTPDMAKNFKKQFDFQGRLYVDQQRVLYSSFGCRRGYRFALSPYAMMRAKEALGMGFSQGTIQGDTWQLGGLFVLTPATNTILFSHTERFGGDSANLLEVSLVIEKHVRATDPWTSFDPVLHAWAPVPAPSSLITSSSDIVIETPGSGPSAGTGGLRINARRNLLGGGPVVSYESQVDKQCLVAYYAQSLCSSPHINYVSAEGVISFEDKPGDKDVRALIRTVEADIRVVVPALMCSSHKDIIQYLCDCTPLLAKSNFQRITSDKLVEALSQFEARNLVTNYKFGVLPIREGQLIEDEWYSNELSPAFETFVSSLADKITLQGWQHFNGGLETTSSRTGEFSRYTNFAGLEVMLHVSPYIPSQASDTQQVSRKRHLGNDRVLIIFKEGSTPFNPAAVFSRFNHVFIVVEPKSLDTEAQADPTYTIHVGCKVGVPAFGPAIPFEIKRSEMRDFLLAKAINSERAAMHAPAFRERLGRYRAVAIEQLVKPYLSTKESSSPATSAASPSRTGTVSPPIPPVSAVSDPNRQSRGPFYSPSAPPSPSFDRGSFDPSSPRNGPLSLSNKSPAGKLLIMRSVTGSEELVSEGSATSNYLSDSKRLAFYAERLSQIEEATLRLRTLIAGGESNLPAIEEQMTRIAALSATSPSSVSPPTTVRKQT